MAHREIYPTRTGRYGTRMLTAGEPILASGPEARAMVALGRAVEFREGKVHRGGRITTGDLAERPSSPSPSKAAKLPSGGEDIANLRVTYFTKFCKRPFNGWNADTLREKIAAA